MNTHELQKDIADTVFEFRGGGKSVTIRLKNEHKFNIKDFIWCRSCKEFHIRIGDPV